MEGAIHESPVTYQEYHISNVIEQFEEKNHLDSHIFKFRNANWFLRIYPHGRKPGRNVSLYLYREGLENEQVFFRIWIEKFCGVTHKVCEKRHTFTVGSNNSGEDCFQPYNDFIKDCRMLDTGTRTIFCFIRVVAEQPPTNYESRNPESEGTVPPTEDHKVPTVTMTVNGKKFHASPKLLIQHSKFFANKVKDNKELRYIIPIEINGCDPDTFDAFLGFLKNGDTGIVTSDTMIGLYKNSSVCEIPELQAKCISFMKQELSLDTFCDIHSLSVVKDENDLPNYITEFFIKNVKNILESDKWQEHLKSHHLRCNELFFEYLSSPSIH